jgi:hypothetical protein
MPNTVSLLETKEFRIILYYIHNREFLLYIKVLSTIHNREFL